VGIFDGIDFNNLPLHFNEDSVKEEIVMPLLKILGYSRFDEANKIISEYRLKDPRIMSGTSENKAIKSDYILQIHGVNVCIVEAKAPSKNISSGKHIKQAYSYASHPEVNAEIFALCNGKELTIFRTKGIELLLELQIADATEEEWGKVFELLSPAAFTFPQVFKYKSDYGLWCLESGLPVGMIHHFYGVYIDAVAKLSDSVYSIQATVSKDGQEYYASFDFGCNLFEAFLSQVPEEKRDAVESSLTNQPFQYGTAHASDSFPISFSAILGPKVLMSSNGAERYIPFNIVAFNI